MKLLREHWVFVLILGVCAVLRLLPLFDYQFTYDELSGLHRTQFNSFSELIDKGVKIDAHPAFVQVLIYYLSKWFGYVNWIIKFPFLLFGFGAILYGYLFGLKNFSKLSGEINALVLSFSLVFVFYAPIARMYISGIYFSLALLFHFFEIFFRNNNKPIQFALLGLHALLCAINQHINALFALTLMLSGFLFLHQENRKLFFMTIIITLLAYLPTIGITFYQLGLAGIGTDQGGWLEKPAFSSFIDFIKIFFGTGRSYLLFVFLILSSVLITRKINLDKRQILLFALFFLNYLIVFFYSILRAPIYQHSMLLFSGMALLVATSPLIEFSKPGWRVVTLILISFLLLFKTYVRKDYLHEAVKTVFEYQFERTAALNKSTGKTGVYGIFFDADSIMRKIYREKYNSAFDFKMSNDSIIANTSKVYFRVNDSSQNVVSSIRLFSEFISTLKTDYVTLSSPTPLYCKIVEEHFPSLIENLQTQGINYKVYSKKTGNNFSGVRDDKLLAYSSVTNRGSFTYSKLKDHDTNFMKLQVDSTTEFPFEAVATYNHFVSSEGQMLVVKAKVKAKEPLQKLELCNAVRDFNTDSLYSYSAKEVSDFIMNKDSTITIYSDLYIGRHHKTIKNKSKLNTYLWNRGGENFELLDFEIELVDYWHNKWHFWE